MKKKGKWIVIIVIGIIVLIQLIAIDTKSPEMNAANDYLNLTKAPIEIATILKQSCYDCHSYQTKYPWYAKVAPVSWMMRSHIQEGREHVNFSKWGDYSIEKQRLLKQECAEEIEDNEMPLKSYTLIHSEAKLTPNSKKMLMNWMNVSEPTNESK